ncbi:type II 3-dehydroquinate dehydratase [Streptomyces sp. NPDC005426]|uniref:type II 3-dehydroquinate dehydratase n=1 Tax=Streptomyces sp. NPDC005426 TaxID=3155344 RepID=UPI0033BA377C
MTDHRETRVRESSCRRRHQREEYRQRSHVAEVADAVIAGTGIHEYALALTHVAHLGEKSTA